MINIAVIFGGVSCEHDISIITGMQVINNLDVNKYNIYPIYVGKGGDWVYNGDFISIDSVINLSSTSNKCYFIPNDNHLYRDTRFLRRKVVAKIDLILVAMHGLNGEDGIIKVVADMSNIKCICPNFLSSALALNKCMFKTYLAGLDKISILPSISYNPSVSLDDLNKMIAKQKFKYPIILKPANLGSSIGISVCHSTDELLSKINYCLRFDTSILIEPKLTNFKEYNIAIFKSRDGLVVSEVEEPINKDEILSYTDKYLSGSKKSIRGMSEAKRVFPAKITAKLKKEIVKMSTLVYNSMNLSGVVRFDFLYDIDANALYLNELNTIPGSFAYYLFNKLTFTSLLDKLIDFEYFDSQKKKALIKYFPSSVLKNGAKGIKK